MMRQRTLFALAGLLAAALSLSGCTELDALRLRTAEQQKQIESLQKENKQFQDAYYQIKSTMDNELAGASEKTTTIQRDLEAAKNLKTAKENELSSQLNTRQLELEASRNEMSDLKKLDAAKITQLQGDLQGSKDETKAALDKLAISDEAQRKEKERADTLSQQQAKLTVDLKASLDSNASLQKDLGAAKSNLLASQKQLDQDKAEAAAAAKQIDGLKKDLDTAQAAAKAGADQAQKNADLEKQLSALKEQQKAQLADLQSKHAEELKTARAEAATSATEAAAKASTAEAVDPDLQKAAEDFKAEIEKLGANSPAKGESARADSAGLHIILPSDALFKKNAVVLSDDAAAMLDPVKKLLGSLSGRMIRIEGHTDDQPVGDLPFADNWGLGFARADRVRESLMTDGQIPPERLAAVSRAQFEPIGDNGSAEGRAKNRRVEIVVAPKPR